MSESDVLSQPNPSSQTPSMTDYQIEMLKRKFRSNPEISREKAKQLGESLQLPGETIETWFENRKIDRISKYNVREPLRKYRNLVMEARFRMDPHTLATLTECDLLGEILQMNGRSIQNWIKGKMKVGGALGDDEPASPEILKVLEDVKQKLKELNEIKLTREEKNALKQQFLSDPSLSEMIALGRTLNLPEEKIKLWVVNQRRRMTDPVENSHGKMTETQRNALEQHFLAGGKFKKDERMKLGRKIGLSERSIYRWHFRRLQKPAEATARRSSEESIRSISTSLDMSESMNVSREETPTNSLYSPVSPALKQWFDDNVFTNETCKTSSVATTPSSLNGPDAPSSSFYDTSIPAPPDQLHSGFLNRNPEIECSQAALHYMNLLYSATAHNSSESPYPTCYGQQPHMN